MFHAEGRTDEQTSRQTYMTKLIEALRNFANAPKNEQTQRTDTHPGRRFLNLQCYVSALISSGHFVHLTWSCNAHIWKKEQYNEDLMSITLIISNTYTKSDMYSCTLWHGRNINLTKSSGYVMHHQFNPLNAELNLICYLLALLGAHHFLHVNRRRVKLLTLRLLMS